MTEHNKPKQRTVAQQANVARARARRYAMQAVYQHLLTGDNYAQIATQVAERESNSDYDDFFFGEILDGITAFGDNLDVQLAPLSSRPIDQLGLVEHAILLVGAYELNHAGTPPKVVINEAITLAKKFAADDSHKFINGVLDKIYQTLQNT